MKPPSLKHAVVLLGVVVTALSGAVAQAPLGTAFTYQGQLKELGAPASGLYDFAFTLYDAAAGGSPLGSPVAVNDWPVDNGLFTVWLNFGGAAFDGQARWIEIAVRPGAGGSYTTLSPRQELTAVPYALYALNAPAGGDAWRLTGNAGTIPGTNFLGTTDNQALELHVNDARALRLEPGIGPVGERVCNVIGGYLENYTAPGVIGATIGGGGYDGNFDAENRVLANFGTVGGGYRNEVSGVRGTVAGGASNTAGGVAVVAGGDSNRAIGGFSAIGGGSGNFANGGWAVIPGGSFNEANANYTFAAGRRAKALHEGTWVWADSTNANFTSTGPNQFLVRAAGGVDFVIDPDSAGGGLRVFPVTAADPEGNRTPNLIGGQGDNGVTSGVVGGTIAGGGAADDGTGYPSENTVADNFGFVGGGLKNMAGDNNGTPTNAKYAVVVGGWDNRASATGTFVGGGYFNNALANYATIAGGSSNSASSTYATVAGGHSNQAAGPYGTVGGGYSNNAPANYATIAGGSSNSAASTYATVAGGHSNQAHGAYGTVAGGYDNWVSGDYGTICGGQYNYTGILAYSTIGGGNFNDATGAYSTVAGGYNNVAHGTCSTVPGGLFDRAGGDYSFAAGNRAKVRDPNEVGGGDTDGDEGTFVWADSTDADFQSTGPDQFLVRATGGVGINTNAPQRALHVKNTSGLLIGASETSGGFTALSLSLSAESNGYAKMQAVRSAGTAWGDLALNSSGGNVGIGTYTPTAKLHIGGTPGTDGLKFPDGTLQTSASRGITGSGVTVDPPNLASGAATSITVTVTGAATGDAVVANPGANLPDGYGITYVRVSAANTITIGFINGSGSSQNPASSTWAIRIIK